MIAAFNIKAGVFDWVVHLEDTSMYTIQKPHNPPYQCRLFKTRSLWVNEEDGYVVWIRLCKSKYHYLLYRFDQDALSKDLEIGETINEFKFDKDTYDKHGIVHYPS